jgi:hypothetical protein
VEYPRRLRITDFELADYTLHPPIPLPGIVADELSISAGGSTLAMTVEGRRST